MTKRSFNRRRGYAEVKPKDGCRSNYEALVKHNLEKSGAVFEYETLRIPYNIEHTYKPDFVLENGIIVEAKGLFLPEDRTKHLKIQKQHPELDIRFIFMKDQKINKTSKTYYSDWCKKHGFLYHIGNVVPKQWIAERGGKIARKTKETGED